MTFLGNTDPLFSLQLSDTQACPACDILVCLVTSLDWKWLPTIGLKQWFGVILFSDSLERLYFQNSIDAQGLKITSPKSLKCGCRFPTRAIIKYLLKSTPGRVKFTQLLFRILVWRFLLFLLFLWQQSPPAVTTSCSN